MDGGTPTIQRVSASLKQAQWAIKLDQSTASLIPGEILGLKRKFFCFKLGPQILHRGCKTEAL